MHQRGRQQRHHADPQHGIAAEARNEHRRQEERRDVDGGVAAKPGGKPQLRIAELLHQHHRRGRHEHQDHGHAGHAENGEVKEAAAGRNGRVAAQAVQGRAARRRGLAGFGETPRQQRGQRQCEQHHEDEGAAPAGMHRQRAAQHRRQGWHRAQRAVQIAVDTRPDRRAETVAHRREGHQRRRARAQALDYAGRVEQLQRIGRGAQRRPGQVGQRAAQRHRPAAVAVGQRADQDLADADREDEEGDAGLQRADRLAEAGRHGGQRRQVDVDAHRCQGDQAHQEADQPPLASRG